MISGLKKMILNKLREVLKPSDKIIFKEREIEDVKRKQGKIKKQIRKKNTIKVVFLVIHDSIWKYEVLYNLMLKDKRFNPMIIIVPLVRNNEPDLDVYYQSLNYFKKNNYNVISSYEENSRIWIDIKVKVNPDIVFFTNPHKLTYSKYFINHFKDKLTCYVPYAFVVISSISMHYESDFFQFLWRYFVETKTHKEYAKSYSKFNIKNVIVTGYPSVDRIFSHDYKSSLVWKQNGSSVKKIIWAPHHTLVGLGGDLDYSSFLELANYMLELVTERKDIQIAFKPHPMLSEKLKNKEVWGVVKTNEYFEKWDRLPNGQVEEGAYLDLFTQSDAMIMDSASFIAEYLYFNKPLFFTKRDDKVKERFNSFGQRIFEYLYQGSTTKDIDTFINEVVINGKDTLAEERQSFFEKEILPENGKTASENIFNELIKELC